ncbi:MAG TPA: phenylalanine--tRNA ligase subunit alpha [Ferrovibrio sp.]|jgi:phenylalanyl-tRNA synthetase alpha chain|uniref:phenylalanine--tRNA ligase subunit alpha n=1 Tax=Ferrovibrio sp. TaxID=1917215 RepID=UPI002B4B7CF6|nr:phenylalanine--tRNA ligase subunit alpha [Ferrovibrio sp.]HLT76530.1 phenylalanine--tRNA ligase subunit alpha [Ferrovibrio sp.]
MTEIVKLAEEAERAMTAASSLEALEEARLSVLGKKGWLSAALKELGALNAEERKARAQQLNEVKDRLAAVLESRKTALNDAAIEARLKAERLDMTLPLNESAEAQGRIHPVSQVIDEITEIFAAMGFSIAEGPDIEDDFHNFTALNMPPEHPARQMQDTFYLPKRGADGEQIVLRTHTSPVQIRTMRGGPPPHRIVVPGRTYRSDYDMTHTPMFHQVEGLVIDRTTHMGHLKGVLTEFCKAFFETENVKMRFRPSYFPFTEPSAEVDINCSREGGVLRVGEGDDWLEILGSGMVHPRVLQHCGLDPNEWQGFAFGMGIDRIAMLKYGIPDLRAFFDADLRWLKHYGFVPLDIPTLGQGVAR